MNNLYRRKSPDVILFLAVIALLGLGVTMVFSASEVTSNVKFGDSYYYLKKQLLWSALGLTTMISVMKFDYWHLKRFAPLIICGAFVLLILVLIPGIGTESHGARRWLFGFQPSEIIKLSIVIFMASSLSSKHKKIESFVKGILPNLIILALACLMILMQPDLGTAVSLAGTVYVMLFAAGAKGKHLLSLGGAGLVAVGVAIAAAPYRMSRFLAFLDPGKDPTGTGYHIIQSLYAIGSGGLFGLGLGKSKQKFFYLPEQHTDFIFAVLGEELGFIGGSLVILLFIVFIWRGLRIALTSQDPFASLLAVGLTTMVGLQAIVNIGVVTGSMPITGIPLPFISFGGTNLVFTLAGIGMLLNISRYVSSK